MVKTCPRRWAVMRASATWQPFMVPTTFAPRARKASISPRPMPREPPVTTTVLAVTGPLSSIPCVSIALALGEHERCLLDARRTRLGPLGALDPLGVLAHVRRRERGRG